MSGRCRPRPVGEGPAIGTFAVNDGIAVGDARRRSFADRTRSERHP